MGLIFIILGFVILFFNLRFKNKRPFTQPEMAMTMHLFNEPIENVRIYFFTQKVKENLTDI